MYQHILQPIMHSHHPFPHNSLPPLPLLLFQPQAYGSSSSSSSSSSGSSSMMNMTNDFASGQGLAPTGPTPTTPAMHPCRIQGELLYRHHRQQYQMRQERVSVAQLSDAYFLLSANAPPSVALPTSNNNNNNNNNNNSSLPQPPPQQQQNNGPPSFSLHQSSSSSSSSSSTVHPMHSSSSLDINTQPPSSSSSSSFAQTNIHSTHPHTHTQSQAQSHTQHQTQAHGQDLGCASSHPLYFPDEDLAAVIAEGIGAFLESTASPHLLLTIDSHLSPVLFSIPFALT